MKTPHARTFLFLLVLPLILAYTFEEDDLVFDDLGEDTNTASTSTTVDHHHNNKKEERKINHQHKKASSPLYRNVNKKHHVQKSDGIKDTSALVGKVFKFRIPKTAFSGSIDHYEVRGTNGPRLPEWLNWDEGASTLSGIPAKSDIGEHRLHVKATGKHKDSAKDIFTVRVLSKHHKSECNERDELIEIILNSTIDRVKPLMKVGAIENLAGYLGMNTNTFSMYGISSKDPTKPEVRIISTGPGNEEYREGEHLAIGWQVGCDGRLWRRQVDIVKDIMDQAKDGRLAEVLQIPVILWRLMVDSSSYLRNRRDIGSGDYDNNPEDYDNYDDIYDDYGEEDDDDEAESLTESSVPRISSEKKGKDDSSPEHPHRHHHGEESINWNMEQIDEHNIIPIVQQNLLASASNNSIESVPSTMITTTTQLTSPATTSTTTIMSSTSTTTTTSTTAPSITTPTTIITTTPTPSTSTAVPTVTSTIADTISPMTESSPKMETTDDAVEESTGQEHLETESESIVTESTTVPIPYVTVIHSSTPNIIDNTTELDVATVFNNSTTKEPSQQIGNASSESATTSSASSTMPVTIATTNVAETILPLGTTNDGVTTSSGTLNPVTINANISTIVPIITTVTTVPTSTSSVSSTVSTTTPAPTMTTPTITITPTTPMSSPPTSTTTTTTVATTPTRPPTTTTLQPRRIPTESIYNSPPKQNKRLRKIAVTAGKLLSYVVPSDTFSDAEDGNTRKLKLRIHSEGGPLKSNHWLQFNPQTNEIYGLPLEKEVSTWDYELIASDSEGLNVSDRLDIHVQQHKFSRTVNHEFVIYLQIDKPSAFASDVDWEIRVLKDLATLYGDQDVRNITAREISIDKDQAIFVWTNDTVPRSSECPVEYINQLARVLTEDKGEIPSENLVRLLAPEIKVKRVHYRGFGQCQGLIGPETLKVTTQKTNVNFPPVPRNQVDHINATVGKLLVFKVPEDTFFDHEDGSSRKMKMDLFTMDRAPIPANEWLQFDTNNQEFYGIPMHKDIGRKEYQLIVTDKNGATATDGLVVIVNPAPVMEYSLEFWATLLVPYNQFIHSASLKRNFVQKLQTLFRDKDTNAISLYNITEGSTVIVWHNTTLPTSYCAHDEINRLQSILVNSRSRGVAERVHKIMGDQFPINQVSVVPMGICADERTGVHSPDNHPLPENDSTSIGTSPDSYLLTIVLPTIIIAAMVLLAGIIACILYRRRRSGKMSVSEQDDERQSFRSKGIPVIFQDELDEKPDPGNKSPVILKEEKPPLPPPEYQKSEDGADVPMLSKENSEEPYQPPPPFATNRDTNRQNRPKPTPTYRKPPPYVPP